MSNFALIAVCLIVGLLLRLSQRVPVSASQVLNAFVIHVSLPAVVLQQVHSLARASAQFEFGRAETLMSFAIPAIMPWLVFLAGASFVVVLGKWRRWNRQTTGALILTTGLGNTSFVGFPVLEALYGPQSIQTGILSDQLGTFLVVSTLGVGVATVCSGQLASGRAMFRRILGFPPFLALLLGLALRGWEYPAVVTQILERLGGTLVPIALIAVGFQLRFSPKLIRQRWLPLSAGLGYKLILAPAMTVLIFVVLMGGRGEWMRVTVIESAMAPMITGAVVASDFGLDAELATLMVGLGIPLSLLTLPLLAEWIQWI